METLEMNNTFNHNSNWNDPNEYDDPASLIIAPSMLTQHPDEIRRQVMSEMQFYVTYGALIAAKKRGVPAKSNEIRALRRFVNGQQSVPGCLEPFIEVHVDPSYKSGSAPGYPPSTYQGSSSSDGSSGALPHSHGPLPQPPMLKVPINIDFLCNAMRSMDVQDYNHCLMLYIDLRSIPQLRKANYDQFIASIIYVSQGVAGQNGFAMSTHPEYGAVANILRQSFTAQRSIPLYNVQECFSRLTPQQAACCEYAVIRCLKEEKGKHFYNVDNHYCSKDFGCKCMLNQHTGEAPDFYYFGNSMYLKGDALLRKAFLYFEQHLFSKLYPQLYPEYL